MQILQILQLVIKCKEITLLALELFSLKFGKLKDYMSPLYKFKKKPIDLHHIFPKNYLRKLGITDKKQINQVSNLVYIEYKKNIKISDDSSVIYWDTNTYNTSEEEINNILAVNCLPKDFYNMDYQTFLSERRKLMADAIKNYFKELRKGI